MKSFTVKNYKNFKDFHLNELKRVNLIVGKNSVGKSSLLEAISIFGSAGSPSSISKILSSKGYDLPSSEEQTNLQWMLWSLSSLYTNRDTDLFSNKPIEFSESESNNVKLKLVNVSEENAYFTNFDQNSFINGFCIDVDNQKHVATLSLSSPFPNYYPVDRKYVVGYLDSHLYSDTSMAGLYDRITLTELEEDLVKALQIIDPSILAINFTSDLHNLDKSERSAVVRCKNQNDIIKLSSMGEGITRILNIILIILQCRNGLFLIDEFDNGLHHSVQRKLWEMIFSLAERLNIQVFATTHSNDCVRSFASIAKKGNGKLIRLQNIDNEIEAVCYDDVDELDYISNNDVETR